MNITRHYGMQMIVCKQVDRDKDRCTMTLMVNATHIVMTGTVKAKMRVKLRYAVSGVGRTTDQHGYTDSEGRTIAHA